jgi:branched-subunit amino acid aminotransferase/4-amino-4-deoxychorismate lyase
MQGKATDVAVRRKSDGRFLWTRSGFTMEPSVTPKFLPSVERAKLSVRIDMGLPLNDVEFVTRAELNAKDAAHD